MFFTFFTNPDLVFAVSGGTLARYEWYGLLLQPFSFLQSFDWFHSAPPFIWGYGRNPHNFILDSAANLGIIFTIISIFSSFFAFRQFTFFFRTGSLNFISLAVVVICSASLVSGTIWDYYSLFMSLGTLSLIKPDQ